MADNRVVRFQGPMNVSEQSTAFPKLADPKGQETGARRNPEDRDEPISAAASQHIYHGRFSERTKGDRRGSATRSFVVRRRSADSSRPPAEPRCRADERRIDRAGHHTHVVRAALGGPRQKKLADTSQAENEMRKKGEKYTGLSPVLARTPSTRPTIQCGAD